MKNIRFNKIKFPPSEEANEDGILAVSREINTDFLFSAYSEGIFPWPSEEEYILWFSPPQRTVLDFHDFRIPERTKRYLKKTEFTFQVNGNFGQVIRSCAESPRKFQEGTWITKKLMDAYIDFNRLGFAWSFEALNSKNELAGGLYGVLAGKYFSGESMFCREDNASKFALINTVNYLRERGLTWMDIQAETPLLKRFGARNISRDEFTGRVGKDLSFILTAL